MSHSEKSWQEEARNRTEEIAKDKPVVIHCRSGSRSAAIYQVLSTQYGFTNLFNLKGGIKAYSQEIDPTLNVI